MAEEKIGDSGNYIQTQLLELMRQTDAKKLGLGVASRVIGGITQSMDGGDPDRAG